MKKSFIFTLPILGLLLFGYLIGRAESNLLENRTTNIRIYALSQPDEKPTHLVVQLKYQNAKTVATRFRLRDDGFCNLCSTPNPYNWYRLEFYEQKKLLKGVDLQLNTGQLSTYENGCVPNLSDDSRQFFSDLINRSPHN